MHPAPAAPQRPRRWRARDVAVGTALGALLPVLVVAILLALPIIVSDALLLLSLTVPLAVAVVACALSRRRPRPLGLVLGSVIGAALLVMLVGGGIGLLGRLLSDP